MNQRTMGILATALTSFVCGCAAIFACGWGIVGLTGMPIDVTSNGVESVEKMPFAIGAVLLCLSVVPVAVGFFTLRKKPEAAVGNEPIPPAS
jgi:hypothetical protein